MQSERETTRFIETNRLIEQTFGRPKRLLEIGSAEGHQSSYLADICDQLVSTDVSQRALTRARRRCPSGTFLLGDVLSDGGDLVHFPIIRNQPAPPPDHPMRGYPLGGREGVRAGADFNRTENALALDNFDLVVACEVLYYVSDVPSALKRMERLGQNCLVTFCDRESQAMLEHMRPVPLAGKDLIRHGETSWHVMWWQSREPFTKVADCVASPGL